MDNVITLTPPRRRERLQLVINFARELLVTYLDDFNKKKLANISAADADLSVSDRNDTLTVVSVESGGRCGRVYKCREDLCLSLLTSDVTSTKSANKRRGSTRGSRSVTAVTARDDDGGTRSAVSLIALQTAMVESDGWDIQEEIMRLSMVSRGWSCREIRKVLQNIQSSVLGSEG
jgi:hypothetical protein